MSHAPSRTGAFIGAALIGLAAGWLLARGHDRGHRADLFAPEPYRRLAALGWIATHDDPADVLLLRDYLAWEPVPALRGRARRIAATLGIAA
ncbi:MAG: hypothetical protein ACREK8_02445 [Gemmatimonadales bacterium]